METTNNKKVLTGKVKWFNDRKGFGFIEAEGIDSDIFVHYSSIETDRFKTLEEDEVVTFTLGEGEIAKRGLIAINVKRQ